MIRSIDNLKKNKNYSVKLSRIRSKFLSTLIVLIFLFSLIFIANLSSNNCVRAGTVSYIPAPPKGVEKCTLNMEYEYTISTIDTGSYWIFDWGDGYFSDWILVEGNGSSVSKSHSWKLTGTYEVRVKHKSIYNVESQWSSPLTVNIFADLDGDGWSDQIEFSYETGYTDPADYPLDTDGDGIPDEDSYDDKYTGDSNDDNDDFDDAMELQIGSDPKDPTGFKKINIDDTDHYLVDINNDGTSNFFYNTIDKLSTNFGYTEDNIYLIDFNGDTKWDYNYNPVSGTITNYKEWSLFEVPLFWLIVTIIAALIIATYVLFKSGILYVYEVEVVYE